MSDYTKLVKELRKMQSVEYCVIASAESFPAIKIVEEAADAIEKLQAYADLYRDGGETAMRLVEQYKTRIEELQKQLQKSEADNVNLTGWLAEEHANNCPHYIRNVHDRGDDSLCDNYKCEVNALPRWIPVTERLPQGGDDSGALCENVCLLMDDGTVSCGWMNGITKKVYYLNAIDDVIIKAPITRVTHWMPLPMPQKEKI